MRSCPTFLVGSCRAAMRLTMSEAELGSASGDEQRRFRGWKLFPLLPRMFLFRPPRGGLLPSRSCWIGSASSTRARGSLCSSPVRSVLNELCNRNNGAVTLSKTAWSVGPNGQRLRSRLASCQTLRELQHPTRSPPVPWAPIPVDLLMVEPEALLILDLDFFLKTLKCARRGVAGGPSGMTSEHFRPVLISRSDSEKFWRMGQEMAHWPRGLCRWKVVTQCCFSSAIYGTPSTNLWQDGEGAVHDVQQGEGGEQGDALMPALFARGQHNALVTLQLRLDPHERLFAFLDDIVVCSPDRVLPIFQALEVELWVHSRIQIHQGKTQLWNKGGVPPPDIDGTRVEV